MGNITEFKKLLATPWTQDTEKVITKSLNKEKPNILKNPDKFPEFIKSFYEKNKLLINNKCSEDFINKFKLMLKESKNSIGLKDGLYFGTVIGYTITINGKKHKLISHGFRNTEKTPIQAKVLIRNGVDVSLIQVTKTYNDINEVEIMKTDASKFPNGTMVESKMLKEAARDVKKLFSLIYEGKDYLLDDEEDKGYFKNDDLNEVDDLTNEYAEEDQEDLKSQLQGDYNPISKKITYEDCDFDDINKSIEHDLGILEQNGIEASVDWETEIITILKNNEELNENNTADISVPEMGVGNVRKNQNKNINAFGDSNKAEFPNKILDNTKTQELKESLTKFILKNCGGTKKFINENKFNLKEFLLSKTYSYRKTLIKEFKKSKK